MIILGLYWKYGKMEVLFAEIKMTILGLGPGRQRSIDIRFCNLPMSLCSWMPLLMLRHATSSAPWSTPYLSNTEETQKVMGEVICGMLRLHEDSPPNPTYNKPILHPTP